MIQAEIITIGDELLIGQVVDTNSAWLGQQLNAIGINVKQITTVSDAPNHIVEALAAAQNRARLIVITGGLGPTKDDVTKKTLAKYFQMDLVMNQEVLQHVTSFFESRNRPMLDVNRDQAKLPSGCEVLHNAHGTAPGMWFEKNDRIWVSMPGVPFEMKNLMEKWVLPKLQSKFALNSIIHYTILTAGLGESFLAQKIESVENTLPPHINLAYLPSLGTLRLRLTAKGNHSEKLQQELKSYADTISALIDKYVIAHEDTTLAQAIMKKLVERNETFVTAESCTGGYIGHQITRHPGSSSTYLGGVISYLNDLKINILGVNSKTIENFGAVSEEVVCEMAKGALLRLGGNYSIAVSGVAGPDGGTAEKPVGTVCIAVAGAQKVYVKTFHFGYQRMQNIELSASNALYMLWEFLKA